MCLLEWQWSNSKQMLDGVEQRTDGMTRNGRTEIVRGDMQIDLRAGDQPMTEKIADGHEANSGAYQVGCKCMSHAMRRQRKTDTAALAPRAYAFVNTAARQQAPEA